MAQTRGGKGLRGSGGNKALLLIELKNRILSSLNKLADRDTQQLAVEDLERLSESLSSEGLSMLLSCLYDFTADAQQKSVVRRECIKMFGTLATLHREALKPHLHKIVANIVRRLKDPDSSIREACVEAMGILAAQIPAGGGAAAEAGSSISIFVKPLLEALGEQNRNLQVGASLCLARVIDCTKDPHTHTLQQLCPRIVKLLNSPSFLANASLLPAIGGLAQVPGVVNGSLLATLISSVEEELEGTEWATRKAAADTLACLATALGPALSTAKASCTAALVTCRFDKVKPVRDSVAEALQLWKTIPDVGACPVPPSAGGDARGGTGPYSPNFSSPIQALDLETSTPTTASKSGRLISLMKSGAAVNASFPATHVHSKVVSEKVGSSLKKKTPPPFSDKKPNPDFFHKLENSAMRDSGWQIEVTIPQGACSPTGLSVENGSTDDTTTSGALSEHHDANGMNPITEPDSPPLPNGFGGTLKCPKDEVPWMGISESATHEPEPTCWGDASVPVTSPDSSSGSYNEEAAGPDSAAAGPDWPMVYHQLQNMEHRQGIIMEMLQEFVIGVHETMEGLQGRVQRLERVVDDIAFSARGTSERMPIGGGSPTLESHNLERFLAAADFLGAKIQKANVGRTSLFADSIPQSGRSRDSLSSLKTADSIMSDAFDGVNIGGSPQSGLPGSGISETKRWVSSLASDFAGKLGSEYVESDQLGNNNQRSRDRASGPPPPPMQQGPGPSARIGWQASKDEATTVAAIRGARPSSDKPASHQNDKTTREYKSEYRSTTTGNNHKPNGGGAFWMLWSHATECVRSGDLNGAYREILGSGDELLLMRMMSRTGPVLHQLNPATALQLIRSLMQMLRQQSFLEAVIPWIQQVSDLVTSNGADSLGLLSGDVRKELVMCLQHASTMEFTESWMSNTISQLTVQLSNALSN